MSLHFIRILKLCYLQLPFLTQILSGRAVGSFLVAMCQAHLSRRQVAGFELDAGKQTSGVVR